MVYEKYFDRVGNRITLTIVVDNLSGETKVHSIGGGAVSESFTCLPREILSENIIKK